MWWVIGAVLLAVAAPEVVKRLREAIPPSGKAVTVALSEWKRGVSEPPGMGWREIDKYIRSADGLTWRSADESNLGADVAYTEDGQFKWCGAFVAYSQGKVGLARDIRRQHLASLYRLHRWARGTNRMVPLEDIKPGDILGTGRLDGPDYGQHMALAVDRSRGGQVATVEGNAYGLSPTGDTHQGVSRLVRPLATHPSGDVYHVLYAVRPLPSDYERT